MCIFAPPNAKVAELVDALDSKSSDSNIVRVRFPPLVLSLSNKTFLMVPWMSGLVSGLQNRVRRFESARNLTKKSEMHNAFRFFRLGETIKFPNSSRRIRQFHADGHNVRRAGFDQGQFLRSRHQHALESSCL